MTIPDIKIIKQLRKMQGLTQAELSREFGVKQSTISRIENGKLDPPYSKAKTMIDFFGDDTALISLWRDRLALCQSPIEKIFYVSTFGYIPHLIPQFQIGKYRVDFAIPKFKLAIEIDGQKFHNNFSKIRSTLKTNQDYERQLSLQEFGWAILRFTGSQIYNNTEENIYRIIQFCKLD